MNIDHAAQEHTGTTVTYHCQYSHSLGRPMEFKVYGTGGKACLVFPCQGGRFYDFENFEMVNTLAPWLQAGKLQLFTVDSVDSQSWTPSDLPPAERTERQEQYFRYIRNELVPQLQHWGGRDRGSLMSLGTSMGGMHAALCFLRCPDVFDTMFSISGQFDPSIFFGDYRDEKLRRNTPIEIVANLPEYSPTLDAYRRGTIICAIGQGDWEWDLLPSNRALDSLLRRRGVPAWFDYWGFDVHHEWFWWHKMITYHFDKLMPLD